MLVLCRIMRGSIVGLFSFSFKEAIVLWYPVCGRMYFARSAVEESAPCPNI